MRIERATASMEEVSQEPDSRQLITRLQAMSGLVLHTPAEAHAYCSSLRWPDPRQDPHVRAWLSAKRCTWLVLLFVTFMQYYLLDAMTEAVTLKSVVFIAPPASAAGALRTEGPGQHPLRHS